MIFVSVGTHERSFFRLFKEVEKLIADGKIGEKVIIQTGYTDYDVKGADCYSYIEQKKMDFYMEKCRLFITHGGLGSIMTGLENNKIVIAVPRLSELGEHTDNHQMEIVREIENQGKIIAVYDINKLGSSMEKAFDFTINKKSVSKSIVANIVDNYLKDLQNLNQN